MPRALAPWLHPVRCREQPNILRYKEDLRIKRRTPR